MIAVAARSTVKRGRAGRQPVQGLHLEVGQRAIENREVVEQPVQLTPRRIVAFADRS
jgi:hypothetical protein